MDVDPSHAATLQGHIERGEAILIIGAGGSKGSLNRRSEPVRDGNQLAQLLCERMKWPYTGEDLGTTLDALSADMSEPTLAAILIDEYKGCKPSQELRDVVQHAWKRIYTFNIDDTLENSPRFPDQQIRRYYNALRDKVRDYENLNYVHIIHLNGYVDNLDAGYIFSQIDYDRRVKHHTIPWYEQAARDYIRYMPIFVGSTAKEPLLWAEVERARETSFYGISFLIIPEAMTKIQLASLRNRGIVHIPGTLETFAKWLDAAFPVALTAATIAASTAPAYVPAKAAKFSNAELDYLQHIRPIRLQELLGRLADQSQQELEVAARRFLRGGPPSWEIAASQIPVWLKDTDGLTLALQRALDDGARLTVIYGQAGSGKTTSTMMSLLHLGKTIKDIDIFELLPGVNSVSDALKTLAKINEERVAIVFINDLYLFGGSLRDELEGLPSGLIFIVATSRSGEWRENFARYLGDIAHTFEFQRFARADEMPLIDRLSRYVPSPEFAKLSDDDKIVRIRSSKSQLLIALREATSSENFDDIISEEYARLPDEDTKQLFRLVGLATIARIGVSVEMGMAIYERNREKRDFRLAMDALQGIVSIGASKRLVARHELYVRHILEDVEPLRHSIWAGREMLREFTRYNMPVIRNVNRSDGHLFRFLLNNGFWYKLSRMHGLAEDGLKIYSEFEIDFQLDGHFWLQYGLYLDKLGRMEDAQEKLEFSIRAYPENVFAEHALARLRLRIAQERPDYDAQTQRLVAEAVETLLVQDAKSFLTLDEYPIVTLATHHVGVLVRHGQVEEAKAHARKYVKRLEELGRRSADGVLEGARNRLFLFLATGQWRTRGEDTGKIRRRRGRASSGRGKGRDYERKR
jgi:hypothetical protein